MHPLLLFVACLVTRFTYLSRNTGVLAQSLQRPIFTSTVRPQYVNTAVKLSLKEDHKVLERLGCDIIILRQEHATLVPPVVDKVNQITVFQPVTGSHRSFQIEAYDSPDHVNG